MKPFHNLGWMRRTTFLCLVLLCLGGAAQALHNHTQEVLRGDADAGKTRCTICVSGHTPQQATAKADTRPDLAREFAAVSDVVARSLQVAGRASQIRPPPSISSL